VTRKYLISVKSINYPEGPPHYSLIYLGDSGEVMQEKRNVSDDKAFSTTNSLRDLEWWLPSNYGNEYWKPVVLDQKGIDRYLMMRELLK